LHGFVEFLISNASFDPGFALFFVELSTACLTVYSGQSGFIAIFKCCGKCIFVFLIFKCSLQSIDYLYRGYSLRGIVLVIFIGSRLSHSKSSLFLFLMLPMRDLNVGFVNHFHRRLLRLIACIGIRRKVSGHSLKLDSMMLNRIL
jgi:hypothetical protein